MYRTINIDQHSILLKLEASSYLRLQKCVLLLETKRERRVSQSEFIRRAIQKACEEVEDSSGFQRDSE